MTNLPDDRIDPYEPRLARRIDAFADQAVRPIDPIAIAAAAHAGARRQTLAGRLFGSTGSMGRFGVVLAGALVAALAFGVYLGAGGNGAPGESPSTPAASASPVPGVTACDAGNLDGGITSWEGAAGHRIATVTIHNAGTSDCALPEYLRPALVDADGHALIVAELLPQPAPITFPAGANATTMVDMTNYCGAAPTAQLLLRFYLPTDASFQATDKTRPRATLDPPPCNGPNAAATIEMQPLTLK
jgi:hypothetical protein